MRPLMPPVMPPAMSALPRVVSGLPGATSMHQLAARLSTIDAELGSLCARVGLLGAATPRDAHLERSRLLADFTQGRERFPVWSYDPSPRTEVRRGLDRVGVHLRHLTEHPLAHLYAERVAELRLETEAAEAVGTEAFGALTRARFATPPLDDEADRLAAAWIEEPEADDAPSSKRGSSKAGLIYSDEAHPRSLLSRLRSEVMRRHLPFTVRTSPSLSALAAVSGDTLWVAEGRKLLAEDVERTVMHEIEAHVLPRTHARRLKLGLFSIGTARGTDDQEGYALWLEERRGFSRPRRRRELAARHLAVSKMYRGADFVEVVRTLAKDSGLAIDAALRTAERAFRGSHGREPGLGREHVYLGSFLRVKARLEAHAADELVLQSGQVALDAIATLRPWTHPGRA